MIKNFTVSTGRPDYQFAYVSKQDVYGGIDWSFNLDQRLMDDLIWLRKHREESEMEAKLRAENPTLDSAYQQYKTMLNLLLDTN